MQKPEEKIVSEKELLEHAKTGEFEGTDLTKLSLKKAELSGARLKGVNLTKVSLKKANLKSADLSGANLSKADISEADLSGADLTGADLTGIYAKGADFTGAKMVGVKITEGSLSGANFSGADLTGSDWSESILTKAKIDGAKLGGIKMADVDATDSELVNVDLSGADLTNACFQNCRIENFSCKNVTGENVDFSLSSITQADFSGSKLQGADFANTLLEQVNFTKTDLTKALFNVSEHTEVKFDDADITGASFKSLTGYTEDQVNAFKERGANVDLFLIRRFFRLLRHSILAKIITLAIVGSIAAGAYFYVTNPENWSFEKLDRQAQIYKGKYDFDNALKLYNIVVSKYTLNHFKVAHAKNQIGYLYLEKKSYPEAETAFKEVLESFKDIENAVIVASMGLADSLRDQKKYDEAVEAYNTIAETWPDMPQTIDAKDRIAKIALATGDVNKARSIYEEIKETYADNAGAVVSAEFDIAELLRHQSKNEQALEKYNQIYETYSADEYIGARALSNILQMQVVLDDLDKAEKTLALLKEKYPNDLNSFIDGELFIANAQSSKQQYDKSEKRLRAIYTTYGDRLQGLWGGSSLADMLVAAQRYDEAETVLNELIETWGKKPYYKNQFEIKKARLYRTLKKYEPALAKVLELMPGISDPENKLTAQLLIADLYIDLKQYDLAQKTYEDVAEINQNSPKIVSTALVGISKVAEEKGDFKKALEYLDEVLSATKNKTLIFDAQFRKVRIYKELKDTEAEENVLVEMVKEHADSPDREFLAKLALAEAYRTQKKYDEALDILHPISKEEIKNHALEGLTSLIRVYSDLKDLKQVEAINKEIATRFPDETKIRINAVLDTANLLEIEGKLDAAIEKYKQAADEGDADQRSRALGRMFHLYVGRQMVDESKALYETIQTELPEDSDIRSNAQLGMANLLQFLKRYDEAEAINKQIIEKRKGSDQAAWALSSLAQSYVEQKRFDDAKKAFAQLISEYGKKSENKVRGHLGLGSIYEQLRQYQDALTEYENAVGVATEDLDVLNVKGAIVRLNAQLGNMDRALTLFGEMKNKYSNYPDSLEGMEFSIAGAYVTSRDYEKGLEIFKRIQDNTKNPTNWANASLAIGNVHLNTGRLAQSLAQYQMVKSKVADNPIALLGAKQGMAQVYLAMKNYNKAIALIEEIIRKNENKEVSIQALTQLSNVYLERGMMDRAEQTYTRLEELVGENSEGMYNVYVGLAEISRRQGKNEDAVVRYEKAYGAAESDGQKISAMTAIAQIYSAQSKFDQAKKAYERIQTDFGQTPNLLLDAKMGEAGILQQNNKFDEAAALYREVIQMADDLPTKAKAETAVAQIYVLSNRTDEAEKAYNDILEKYKQFKSVVLEAKSGLASMYNSKGMTDKALDIFGEIENLTTDKITTRWAQTSKAQILAGKGRLGDAEKIYRKIINENKDDAQAYFDAQMGLADIMKQQGKADQALAAYKNLLDVSEEAPSKISIRNAMTQIYLQKKDYAQAKKIFQDLIAANPDNLNTLVDAKLGLANTYKESKDTQKAKEAYQDLIDNYADSIQTYWAYMGLAQIQSELGQVEAAQETYKAISDKFPQSDAKVADAKLNNANMLKNSNRRADALASYDEIIDEYKDRMHAVWAMQGKAQIYVEGADFDKAEQAFDSIILQYGKWPDAVADAKMGKAGLLAMAGKNEQAVAAYEKLLPSLDSERSLQAKKSIAQTYLSTGQEDKAAKVFNSIIKDYKNNPEAILDAKIGLGELEYAEGNYDNAEKTFIQVAEESGTHPRTSWALQSLAKVYTEQEKFAEVSPIVNRIRKDFPDDPNAVINIEMNVTNKLLEKGQYDQALARIEPVIKKYQGLPQTAWAEHSKAQIYTQEKNYDTARELYKNIITKYESNQAAVVDAINNLGQIEIYEGNLDKAEEIFRGVADKYPEFQQAVTALFALGQIYERKKNDARLEVIFKRIISNYSSNKTAFLNASLGIGNLYNKQRKFREAIEVFQKVYNQYPDDDQAAWAMSGAVTAFIALNDEASAENLLKQIIAKYPKDNAVAVGARATLDKLYSRK